MELKLIKHDGALKELTEFEAPERLTSTLPERLIIFGRNDTKKKRWIKQLSLGNGKVME